MITELDMAREIALVGGEYSGADVAHKLLEYAESVEKAEQAIWYCEPLKEWGRTAEMPKHHASRVTFLCNLYSDAVHTIRLLSERLADQRDLHRRDLDRIMEEAPHSLDCRSEAEQECEDDCLCCGNGIKSSNKHKLKLDQDFTCNCWKSTLNRESAVSVTVPRR